MSDQQKLELVTIGGGKGQANILAGLKKYSYRLDISAIVSMVDNGGSTGKLSEELQIPPFGGDFKDVLTSLSHHQTMVDLWQHRFEHGDEIRGHTVGNLILLALLEQSKWEIPEAIKLARGILDLSASVYPSTLDRTDLVAEYGNGDKIRGQDEIDNNMSRDYSPIEKIYLDPEPQAYQEAIENIEQAEAIVLCPGDIYGSLLCNIVVPGIAEAIARSEGKIIYITNLMTKANQTLEWKTSQFVGEIQKYLHRDIDTVIVNSDDSLSSEAAGAQQYEQESWEMVKNDLDPENLPEHVPSELEVIADKIWYEGKEYKRVSSDVIPRSFIRHDPAKIAEIILGHID